MPRYCSAGKFHIVFDAQNEGRCSSFVSAGIESALNELTSLPMPIDPVAFATASQKELKCSARGSQRAFMLDGTSLRLAYSPALAERLPVGSKQHGESHW